MSYFESPLALLAANLLLLITGAVVLLVRKARGSIGAWLVRAALVLFAVNTGLAARVIPWGSAVSSPHAWLRGWVLPPDQVAAMTVGLALDAKAIVLSIVAAILLAAFLADPRQEGSTRQSAAAAIGAAGLSLTWASATPWMAFFGLVITLIGGYAPLCFDTGDDPRVANQYAWQRFGALMLTAFGATALAGTHAPWLLFGDPMFTGQGGAPADVVAGGVLACGLFLLYQPFPMVSWSVVPARLPSHARLLTSYVFPGLAAFLLLAGVKKELVALEIFPGFGWIALVGGLLALVAGLFHSSKEAGLRAWLSGAGALAVACLALTGSESGAFSIFLTACLGAFGVSAGAAPDPDDSSEPGDDVDGSRGPAGAPLSVGIFLCMAAGTGVIGFASAGSWASFAGQFANRPVEAIALGLVYFAFVTLAWKLARDFVRTAGPGQPAASLVVTYAMAIAALGLFWTGSLSGGALAIDSDRVFSSILAQLFVASPAGEGDAVTAGLAICSGISVIGAILGVWLAAGEGESHFERWRAHWPRLAAFASEGGFGTVRLAERARAAVEIAGVQIERWVDTGLWDRVLPRAMFVALGRCAAVLTAVSERISAGVAGGVRAVAEAPGKALQLTQTGNVQWYMFFGLGTGVLICLYFLRG